MLPSTRKPYKLEAALVTVDRLSGTLARQEHQIKLEQTGTRREHRPPSPRGSRPWLRAKAEKDKKKAQVKAVVLQERDELERKEREQFEATEAERLAAEEAEAQRIAEEEAAREKEEEEKVEAMQAAEDPNTGRGAWANANWPLIDAFLRSAHDQGLDFGGYAGAQRLMHISKAWRETCLHWCRDIEVLHFRGGAGWDACEWGQEAMASIVRTAPKVRVLHLEGFNGVALSQLHLLSEQLEELTFTLCTDAGATLENNKLSNLHSLKIVRCRDLNADGLRRVAVEYRSLRSLRFEGCDLGNSLLSFARNLPDSSTCALRHLFCDSHVPDEIIRALTRACTTIEKLTLYDARSAVAIRQPAMHFVHLRSLDVQGGERLVDAKLPWTDDEIDALAQGCQSLTHLRLANCGSSSKLTGAHLASFQALTHLSITNLTGSEISQSAMAALGKSPAAARLERIDFSGSKLEGLGVLAELVGHCVMLEYLELAGVQCKMKDENLPVVACGRLKHLGVSRTDLGSGALTSIVKGCEQLVSLDLRFMRNIDDVLIAAITWNAAPRITRLELEGCEGFSRKSLTFLFKACKALDLRRPDGIRCSSAAELVDALCGVDPTMATLSSLFHSDFLNQVPDAAKSETPQQPPENTPMANSQTQPELVS